MKFTLFSLLIGLILVNSFSSQMIRAGLPEKQLIFPLYYFKMTAIIKWHYKTITASCTEEVDSCNTEI